MKKLSYSVSVDIPFDKLTWLLIALVASWCAISIYMILAGTLDPDRTVLCGLVLVFCLYVPLRSYISLRQYRGLWLVALAMELSRLGVPLLLYTPVVILSILCLWRELLVALINPMVEQ